ncbi:PTS lactose/cellobiose transporter subunit IIA [Globicatella sulfidifaciens]|uniref:PTS lactose/cellobiose transporter subunit IIA n=1 Tax=Globicatella sulfidifaciens TaxID=136093 RepID=UPI00288DBE14|nr:PTS lactose/cellobiose transporter subunit IIA [Globicatella sulfidifaciens]MDT2767614.1 PTS lactose/cellobiose transporter subunit IIA [Globicatella sulfidifaciens]
MEGLELSIFNIISNGGNAKGLVYEAMEAAEKGDFEQADSLMNEADEFLKVAHQTQTELLQGEANGDKHDISLLMVHAQDHLMTSIEVRNLADMVIRMNKRLHDLETKD